MPVIPENIINLQTDTIPQTIIEIDIDDSGKIFVQLAHAQAVIAQGHATTAGNYASAAQGYADNASDSADTAEGYLDDAEAAADRAEAARDAAEELIPGEGRVGDFLQKTVDGAQWASFPEGIGTWGGIIGDIRNQTDLQESLATKITNPEGQTGQLLSKTADGTEWVDAPNSAVWGLIAGDIDDQADLNNTFGKAKELTQAQYDALPASKLTDNVNYFIKDGAYHPQGSVMSANGVMYDNTESGLDATTVQGAIDENASEIADVKSGLSNTNGRVTSIENSFLFKTITPTASISQVSITFHSVRQYGNVLYYSIGFTTSAAVTQYSSLISFGKKAESAWISPVYTSGYDRTDYAVYGDKDNQTIRAGTALPAGSYRVAGSLLVQ